MKKNKFINELLEWAQIEDRGFVRNMLWSNQYCHLYVLQFGGERFKYYCGVGIKTTPTKEQILGALASDWKTLDGMTDEEFLCEFGYNKDADSMKQGFQIIREINNNIGKLLARGIELKDIEQFIEE